MRRVRLRGKHTARWVSLLCVLAFLAGCGASAATSPTATATARNSVVAATSTPFAFAPFATPVAPSATATAAPSPATTTIRPTPSPTTPRPSAAASPITTKPTVAALTSRVSEGVHVTGADAWQAAGITGKGVKVGIIDSSFTDYKQFLGGVKVTARSFRANGVIEDARDPDGIHGTACAEIVHEMAPDAELFLAVEHGMSEFADAVQWLTSVGVTVISYSNGWDGEYPPDGTSRAAQAVDTAQAAGVFVAVAAGNSGSGKIGSHSYQGHYGAMFTDTDGDGFHDFSTRSNAVEIRLNGDPIHFGLEWDDWASPHVTYSFFIYDANGKEVARGNTPISVSHNQPVQIIDGTFPAGKYMLKVRKEHASDPNLRFSIFFDGAQFAEITPEGSLTIPADAKGAVAVGEADWADDGVLLSSAQGPTRDGRTKPELIAPSCVTNAAIARDRGDGFCGTSAAAPHVAGAAALYKQAFPNASPDAILAYLQQHADASANPDLGPNIVGAGRLDLGPVPAGIR